MASHFRKLLILLFFFILQLKAHTQHYQALYGSSYAGSLGVGNNPSSMLNTPYPWDLTIFGTQAKYSTNAVTIYNYSLLKSAAKSQYLFDEGYYKRYAYNNANANLLNARIALNRRNAIAFGLNVRGYGNLETSNYYFIDTIKTVNQFLKINQPGDYALHGISSNWVEIYGTYSRTIIESETHRLNAGLTLKALRGLSGAFLQFTSAFTASPGSPTVYQVRDPVATYGYSSNTDYWKKEKGSGENLNDVIDHSEGSLSMDLGAEFIIKSQSSFGVQEDDGYYDYDWKFGISFLDLGFNNYTFGTESRQLQGLSQPLTDVELSKRLKGVKSLAGFNDSLAAFINMQNLSGNFKIINPARMMINVDRYLGGDFYLNTDITVNLASLAGEKRRYVRDLNLLSITPRWETRQWGFYLPVSYNTQKNVWVGGAFKVGPLLMGIHNWGNIFSSQKMQRGGGYITLTIHPSHVTKSFSDKRYDCPPQ